MPAQTNTSMPLKQNFAIIAKVAIQNVKSNFYCVYFKHHYIFSGYYYSFIRIFALEYKSYIKRKDEQ